MGNEEIYNKWITESPKIILQHVLITLKNSESVLLGWVDISEDDKGNYRMTYSYPPKAVLAYMRIPTMDVDTKGWHGEYTDGLEPKKDGEYIVCLEIKKYNSTKYILDEGYWQKDRFFGCNYEGGEVIGWREYPRPFTAKEVI